MNARHAAAPALVSWLFITPPFDARTGGPVPQAPLTAWTVYGTYATKVECLNRRAAQIRDVARYDRPRDPKLEKTMESIEQLPSGMGAKLESYR
jgi:hypothetical protein